MEEDSPLIMDDDNPLISDTVQLLPFSDRAISTSLVGKKFIPKASSEISRGMVPRVGTMGTGKVDCG